MIELPTVATFWYLSSPYSKYPHGHNMAHIHACMMAAELVRRGIPNYCPIAETHPIAVYGKLDLDDHDIWLPADRPKMEAAGGIIVGMMDGWRDSYGISVEIEYFQSVGKPVRFMTFDEMVLQETPDG